jgi:thymidine phosphorylase
MDTPLGRAVGNAVEVEESVATLRGQGPADLVEVTLALAADMLRLAGLSADPAAALADGSALERYREMIKAQGGDPEAPLESAEHAQIMTAQSDGWLQALDARGVGVAAWRLGAGRARKEDPVSPSAGIICLAKPGDAVAAGQPLLELRADDHGKFDRAREALADAIVIGPDAPEPAALVLDRIG